MTLALQDAPVSVASWFPWWPSERDGAAEEEKDAEFTGIVKTRLASGQGCALLVDTGSPDNLCSDENAKEMAAEAIAAGRGPPTYARLDSPIPVGGIGKGIQVAKDRVNIPIGLNYDTEATYSAPELPNSSIPGLLGRKAMKEHRVLLDCFNNKFYTIGPGGYKLQLSPGSNVRDLEESPAGHLMLPCTRYPSAVGPSAETLAVSADSGADSCMQIQNSDFRARETSTNEAQSLSSPSVSTPKSVEPVLDVNLAHPSASTSSWKSTATPKGSPQAGVPAVSAASA